MQFVLQICIVIIIVVYKLGDQWEIAVGNGENWERMECFAGVPSWNTRIKYLLPLWAPFFPTAKLCNARVSNMTHGDVNKIRVPP